MKLILLGYMGSGKSTVGRKLSGILNYDYLDLDAHIEEKEKSAISEVFKTKGEIHFRKLETKYLKDALTSEKNSVISLGGGTPCYGRNMELIKNSENATSIYLKASIANLTDRLFLEKDSRPLISHLKSKTALSEFIGKHLFERAPIYGQSDFTIITDNMAVDSIVEAIVLKLF